MTLTFFSNYLVHHQTPFCEAMARRLGDGFRFVATEPIEQERLDMGYENLEDAPYAVNAYRDEESFAEALRLADESDVVIIGSAPDSFIENRLKKNKLTFRYSERLFKKFRWRFDPRAWRVRRKKDTRYRRKNLHLLCASAYTAPDCRFVFAYPRKTYKWGYFPQVEKTDFSVLAEQKAQNRKIKLIWVSRFIPLKHPEEVIKLAQRLKDDGTDFELEMLGTGALRDEYENKVRKSGLSGFVTFAGPLPPGEVLAHMRGADIFLFTSDKNEGWGAVMNEAMSSACAVVACREIGSVPYLIRDGENGLIYKKRGKKSLYACVRTLIDDENLRARLQRGAYDTIFGEWNAETAAKRLLHLIDCINRGEDADYGSGPCSRA